MKQGNPKKEYDVIIIGGGATGAGTARDCALRGLSVLLVERHDFATGATGRNHGLLHSGARYAVTDQESASECIEENKILRRIASHCVEENDGLFITLPEDDISFQPQFVKACKSAGINAEVIDPAMARKLEPSVNPDLIGAVRVPDGSVDPFRLTMSNALDAKMHDADLLTQHEIIGILREQGRVVGVKLLNHLNQEKIEFYGKFVVNAGGIWGQRIANFADVKINMFPAKGALLIYGHRVNNMVINRCRKPSNADILVPGDTICLIGTTSERIPYDEIDNMTISREDVDILMREGGKLAPSLLTTRVLRAYAGVRPLVAADNDPSGRSISRGIVLLDHEKRDGLPGFVTITGGKLMTYRLMAEWTTDLLCQKLSIEKKCETAVRQLPGSEKDDFSWERANKNIYSASYPKPGIVQKSAKDRHGSMSIKISTAETGDDSMVCECEGVSVGEVKYAIQELHANSLVDLRRRTRIGMGTCQGELCSCRAACQLAKATGATQAREDLQKFLQERWKGMSPVAWGETIDAIQFTSWIYEGIYGLKPDTTQQN